MHVRPAVLTIAHVCVMFAQFYDQSDLIGVTSGLPYAHYRGVQHGALRLCSKDGQTVVPPHALFKVVEFAADKVVLVGDQPVEIKGKFVQVSVMQWGHLF